MSGWTPFTANLVADWVEANPEKAEQQKISNEAASRYDAGEFDKAVRSALDEGAARAKRGNE